MDNAQDIIQFALDNLGHEVKLAIIMDDIGVVTRYATLKVIANARKRAGVHQVTGFIEVTDYRFPDGQVIAERTLIDIDQIVSIERTA